jgi:hypothetical protein
MGTVLFSPSPIEGEGFLGNWAIPIFQDDEMRAKKGREKRKMVIAKGKKRGLALP